MAACFRGKLAWEVTSAIKWAWFGVRAMASAIVEGKWAWLCAQQEWKWAWFRGKGRLEICNISEEMGVVWTGSDVFKQGGAVGVVLA